MDAKVGAMDPPQGSTKRHDITSFFARAAAASSFLFLRTHMYVCVCVCVYVHTHFPNKSHETTRDELNIKPVFSLASN